MKSRFAILLVVAFLLAGCGFINTDALTAKRDELAKQAQAAVEGAQERLESAKAQFEKTKNSINAKVEDVQNAARAVQEATKAVQDAVEAVKKVTGDEEQDSTKTSDTKTEYEIAPETDAATGGAPSLGGNTN